MSKKKKVFKFLFLFCFFSSIITSLVIVITFVYYSFKLPDMDKLDNLQYQLTTRLYSDDGILLKEYANEKRIFIKFDQIPDVVKNAFISAEDKNFYKHKGIDIESIISASIYNVYAYLNDKQFRGGSTITQQVVKNILLTNERTLSRKIKEAILSYKVTKKFSKEKVLEIYLNYIFLGNNSYGVAAASLNYFNKSLDEITISEAAVLASLPKAPAKLNPALNKEKAIIRRNYVIERMLKNNHITKEEYDTSIKAELVLFSRNDKDYFNAGAFTEDTRKKLLNLYDENSILTKGLVVSTTIKPNIQTILNKGLKNGLEEYDKRHGYRGELGNLYKDNEKDFLDNWPKKLLEFNTTEQFADDWEKAVLLDFDLENNKIIIGLLKSSEELFSDGELLIIDNTSVVKSSINIEDLMWVVDPEQLVFTNNIEDILDKDGNIIQDFKVEKITDINLSKGSVFFVKKNFDKNKYEVKQFPKVNGGAVALDPHTGRIFAMVGGYIDSETNFNRVTQANRQLGSIIKPFVYLTAFENGYNGTDKIMDEEIVFPQGNGEPPYKPKNFANKYYGMTTLRRALQSSYNVSTVRLGSQIGLNNVANTIKKFNINSHPKRVYSMVLGSLETKLINIVNAYGMIVNGGKYIERETIEKIQDSEGKTIYKRDTRKCIKCNISEDINVGDVEVPFIEDNRKTITDPATAYQITSILEGVIKYGTGAKAKSIGKIIGGKTGTSNDFKDAWFIGFSPDLIVGVFVGFDDNTSLGKNETGSRAASPIFISVMKEILKDEPSIPFRVPENIVLKRIDISTGESPTLISKPWNIIFEAFKKDKIENISNADDGYFNMDNEEEDIFEMKNKFDNIMLDNNKPNNIDNIENNGDEIDFNNLVF